MIQIVDQPILWPQRCYFTNDSTPQPILDTGQQDPEDRRIYIALHYLDELARTAGYIHPDEAAELREQIRVLSIQAEAVPGILEGLADDVRNLAAGAQLDLLSLAAGSGVADDAGGDEAAPRTE